MGSGKYKFMKANKNKPAQQQQQKTIRGPVDQLIAERLLFQQREIETKTFEAKCQSLISFANIYKDKIIFKKCEKPLVSIIIPVYNQYSYTKTCLYTVLQNTKEIDYEVIIADDNSTDETQNIGNDVDNIAIVRNNINQGFLKNVNNAAKYAKGKYLCLLNNDTLTSPGWLTHLLECMESHKNAGIVGAKFIDVNGFIAEAGAFMTDAGVPGLYAECQNASPDTPEFNVEKEVDYCSGAGVLVKKSGWDEVGGFDELFAPAFYEDPDLSFMFKYQLGLKTYYQPRAEIIHFHNVSYQHSTHNALISKPKFIKKWEKELNSGAYRPLS